MKKSQFLFRSLPVLALTLRFLALCGGAELMIIALMALAILYLYLGFALLNHIPYRAVSSMRMVGAIGVGMRCPRQ